MTPTSEWTVIRLPLNGQYGTLCDWLWDNAGLFQEDWRVEYDNDGTHYRVEIQDAAVATLFMLRWM